MKLNILRCDGTRVLKTQEHIKAQEDLIMYDTRAVRGHRAPS